jgi:hypothetical protein
VSFYFDPKKLAGMRLKAGEVFEAHEGNAELEGLLLYVVT